MKKDKRCEHKIDLIFFYIKYKRIKHIDTNILTCKSTYIKLLLQICNCSVHRCPAVINTGLGLWYPRKQQRKWRHLHVGFRLYYFNVRGSVAGERILADVQLFLVRPVQVTKTTAEPLPTAPGIKLMIWLPVVIDMIEYLYPLEWMIYQVKKKLCFALTYYVFKEYNASFNGSYEYER